MASGFGDAVRALSEPYYEMDRSRGGRPGIDPEVYFKMQMVGFFEGIASERGIAARCADSLSIRQFLHYELHESTPDHSSLTVIRQRLGSEVYEQVFALVLKALRKHKLLRGKKLGIDASVMEVNARGRSLEHWLMGEDDRAYVRAVPWRKRLGWSLRMRRRCGASIGTGRVGRQATTLGRTRMIRTQRSGVPSRDRRG